jgi:hypothetical protein
MVYGLLSLVSPESKADALEPDYGKTKEDVFADTVRIMIQLYSQLATLAYVSHPEGYHGEGGYRSWAPRWDDPDVLEGICTERDCPWNACAGHDTEASS